MYPILVSWQDIVVPTWYACFLLAALAALWLLLRLQPRTCAHSTSKDVLNLYLICYASGYIGARGLSLAIEDPCRDLLACASQLLTLGSLTLYGGVVLAFLCGLLYVKAKHLPLRELLDCFVPALLLAVCIGRIGCFLNGDDYGIVTDSVWGVVFPNLGDGLARYPTQLFEAAFCLLLCLLCWAGYPYLKTRLGVGATGLCGAGGYALLRFANEYLRGDYRGWVVENMLSTSQFISIIIFIGVLLGLAWGRRASSRPKNMAEGG